MTAVFLRCEFDTPSSSRPKGGVTLLSRDADTESWRGWTRGRCTRAGKAGRGEQAGSWKEGLLSARGWELVETGRE